MSVVYIGHIGAKDHRWVLKIAESVGTVDAFLYPCISRSKKSLSRNCQYCMIIKMKTPAQAVSLVEFIGTEKWDHDFCLKESIIAMDEPLIYAELIK